MIELLILYVLIENELTMYAVLKLIHEKFGVFTRPSFGAIKTALNRLCKNGYIKSRRVMSDGGKQSCFYSITNEGNEYLLHLMTDEISENPLQFYSNLSVKVACAASLPKNERKILFEYLKKAVLKRKYEAENSLNLKNLDFYQRIIIDNAAVQYKNLVTLLENFEKDTDKL